MTAGSTCFNAPPLPDAIAHCMLQSHSNRCWNAAATLMLLPLNLSCFWLQLPSPPLIVLFLPDVTAGSSCCKAPPLLDAILHLAACCNKLLQYCKKSCWNTATKCGDAVAVNPMWLLCCSFLSLHLPLQCKAIAISLFYSLIYYSMVITIL